MEISATATSINQISFCDLPNDALREIFIRLIPKSLTLTTSHVRKNTHKKIDAQFLSISTDIISLAISSKSFLSIFRLYFNSFLHKLSTSNLYIHSPNVLENLSYIPIIAGDLLQDIHLAKDIPTSSVQCILKRCFPSSLKSLSFHDGNNKTSIISKNFSSRLTQLQYLSIHSPTFHTLKNIANIHSLHTLELINFHIVDNNNSNYNLCNIQLNNLTNLKNCRIALACNNITNNNTNSLFTNFTNFIYSNLPKSICHLRIASNLSSHLKNHVYNRFSKQKYITFEHLQWIYIDDYNDTQYALKLTNSNNISDDDNNILSSSPSSIILRKEKRPRTQDIIHIIDGKKEVSVDDFILGHSALDMRNSFLSNHGYTNDAWNNIIDSTDDNMPNGPDILRLSRTDLAFLQGMGGRHAFHRCIQNIKLYAPNATILRAWPDEQLQSSSKPLETSYDNDNNNQNTENRFSMVFSNNKPSNQQPQQMRNIISCTKLIGLLFKSFPSIKILHTTCQYIIQLSDNPVSFHMLIKSVPSLHISYTNNRNNNIHKFLNSINHILIHVHHNQTVILENSSSSTQKHLRNNNNLVAKVKDLTQTIYYLQNRKLNLNLSSVLKFLNEL